MKSVVSLIKDFCFSTISRSNVSTNEDIRSVSRAVAALDDGSTNQFRFVDFCKRVEYWYSRQIGSL